jgi:hypothetical protein
VTDQGPFAHWQKALQPRTDRPRPPGSQPGLLPPIFQFSQNSLQDYADCARRFQLRYVLGQRWPAAESEPIDEHEQLMEQGTEFHRLVQRHLLGIPAEKLAPVAQPLAEWWDAYLHTPPPDLPQAVRLPEAQLTIPFGAYRLLAKFDLLAIEPGQRAVIVDWKTTRSRPTRDVLARRLQSRVYPYVLVEAGAHLFGSPLDPAQVSLVYWFAGAPGQPEVFHYAAAQHAGNRAFLTALVDDILAHREDIWPLTDDEFHCRYCVYRSLCDRGVRAGALDDGGLEALDADFDFEIDIADVDEIAF